MEKKKTQNRFNHVFKICFIALVGSISILPLSILTIGIRNDQTLGNEKTEQYQKFTINGFLTKTYQQQFESWFTTQYPMRAKLVQAFRKIKYNIESSALLNYFFNLFLNNQNISTVEYQIPNAFLYTNPSNKYKSVNEIVLNETIKEPTGFKGQDGVIVGKSGYLYETLYLDEYLGFSKDSILIKDNLVVLANKLKYIQNEIEKRGMEFIYLITPSKASEYPYFIPEFYKNSHTILPGYQRQIDCLVPLLQERNINVVNSSDCLKKAGLLNSFPKTGTHWNYSAAAETSKAIIDLYNNLAKKKTSTFEITGYEEKTGNLGLEQDIYNVLYSEFPEYKAQSIVDDFYFQPTTQITKKGEWINIVSQGGSFLYEIRDILKPLNISEPTIIFYYDVDYFKSVPNGDIWNDGPEGWAEILKWKDLLILECNESVIRSNFYEGPWEDGYKKMGPYFHNTIYDSLYAYLKNHEGEY